MERMKKVFLFCMILILLTACAGKPASTAETDGEVTAVEQTTTSQVIADINPTLTGISTQTLPPAGTWTPVPTLEHTRPSVQTPTAETPCDLAAAGHPIDVTIPDGTVLEPGETFSKTWRLENVGLCKWSRQYAVVLFSGNSLNAYQTNYLSQEVEPGDVIDVTVDMEAPLATGSYQSNWMLSNSAGELFGIGPNGDAPFWVQIEVLPSITDTPAPTATVTSTPVVFLTGGADLGDGDQFDLDGGELNPGDATQVDFIYQVGGDPTHVLMTMNGTAWVVYGELEPTLGDCEEATMAGNAISFEEVPTGTYVCYLTSDSLPGRMLIEGFEEGKLALSFLTWAVP